MLKSPPIIISEVSRFGINLVKLFRCSIALTMFQFGGLYTRII